MGFICEHGNPVRPAEPFSNDQCRICWLRRGGVAPLPRTSLPCRHEGAVLEFCPTCKGRQAEGRHVRDCDLHDRCTRQTVGPAVRGCDRCGDYEPHPEPGLRHLAYHLMPTAGPVWRLGVDQLRQRWPLFTGRKVVAVATGPGLDPAGVVRDYLPADADVLEIPNDPGLREVATWGPIWDTLLPHCGPDDAVLYCHGKGVTRPLDAGNSCHWWASLAYSLHLDHWDEIAAKLRVNPIVGAFKKVGRGFGGLPSHWHYSGTFFWVRAGEFGERYRATPMPRHHYGVEAWPGIAYRADEAGWLFMEGRVPTLDLYEPRRWKRYREEYATWIQQHPPAWPWLRPDPARTP